MHNQGDKMKNLLLALGLGMSIVGFAGDAGCGLGSIVMRKNVKISQTLAITTNGTFSSQLLGVIFGTSGCGASGWVQNKVEALRYAEANFENLKVDIARGEGESINSVGSLLGCQEKSLMEFSKMSQSHFLEIVPANAKPTDVIDSLDQKIKSDQKLRLECLAAA
jgi:hypothetical protein